MLVNTPGHWFLLAHDAWHDKRPSPGYPLPPPPLSRAPSLLLLSLGHDDRTVLGVGEGGGGCCRGDGGGVGGARGGVVGGGYLEEDLACVGGVERGDGGGGRVGGGGSKSQRGVQTFQMRM